jgi:triacylglycerol lipase
MWHLIFFVLMTVFLILPVFTYLIFWYETANGAYGPTLYRESRGKPYGWLLKGIFSSICTNAVVICLYPLGFFKNRSAPDNENKGKGPLIVLIHGVYHNNSAWIYYKWRLRKKGYGRIYTFGYSSRGGNFWEIYEKLSLWMKRFEREAQGQEIVLLGHSLGGLLAKTYAAKQGESARFTIQRVMTIGSPFRGSKMVVFSFGALAKSLQYQGPLVRELEKLIPVTKLPCVAFYSPVDNMVLPAESMLPPPEWKKEQTAPLCHTAALYDGPNFNRVLSYIEKGD